MFLRKSEPKRGCHPCVIMVLGALAVVGAVSIANNSRALMCRAKEKMTSIFHKCDDEEC